MCDFCKDQTKATVVSKEYVLLRDSRSGLSLTQTFRPDSVTKLYKCQDCVELNKKESVGWNITVGVLAVLFPFAVTVIGAFNGTFHWRQLLQDTPADRVGQVLLGLFLLVGIGFFLGAWIISRKSAKAKILDNNEMTRNILCQRFHLDSVPIVGAANGNTLVMSKEDWDKKLEEGSSSPPSKPGEFVFPYGCPQCDKHHSVRLEGAPPFTYVCPYCWPKRRALITQGKGYYNWRIQHPDGSSHSWDISTCKECHAELSFYSDNNTWSDGSFGVCKKCGSRKR